MPTPAGDTLERLTRRFGRIQRGASLALVLLGSTVIAGWVFGLPQITALQAGLSTMKFNTALGFVFTGAALYGLGPHATPTDWKRAQWLGLALLLLALTTLLQYPLGTSFGIDNLLYAHPQEAIGAPGRMSGFTALSFLLLGIGIWVEVLAGRRGAGMTQVAAVLLFLMGLLGVLGFIYRAPKLLNFIPGFGTLSVHTAIGILIAALALALVRPDGSVGGLLVSPSDAGRAAREMLFLQIGFLLLFILLNVTLERRGVLDEGEAASIRNLAIISVLLISGWKALGRLDSTERKLRDALAETQSARDGLEAAVAQRTVELASASLRAESARAQFASVLASTPALVAAIDTSMRFTVVNTHYAEAAARDQGVTPVPGMHFDELFARNGTFLEQGRALWQRALAGERFTTTSIVPLHDRDFIVYRRAFGPVVNQAGEIVGAVGLLEDITEQQRVEMALERQRRLLNGIMMHGDAAIFVKDAGHRYVLCNPRYGRMLGRSVADIVGHTDAELVEPRLARMAVEADNIVLREQRVHQREVELDVPGEGRRHYLISKVPIPSEREGEWLVCGMSLDITDRKEAEAQLQERNRDLETLLHVTSHDLREPLRAIASFSRMARERHAVQLDDSGRDMLERITRAAGRMNGLIDDIMRLSQARRAQVTPEPVPASALIDEVRTRLEERIQETGATITVDPTLPQLLVDRGWATQALYNLVANALKFTEGSAAPEVTISGFRKNGHAGLVVADRGPGIEPEHRERIFELFQRAVGREVEGSGAGLAIVQQVAARHAGRAYMQPRDGGGSEFVIEFGRQSAAMASGGGESR